MDPDQSLVLTAIDSFYDQKGVERVPRDFSTTPIEMVNGDGGTPISGTVLEPGRFRFDVPPGAYLLKNGTAYILVSWRSVDIGFRRMGRPNRGGVFFPAPASASLDLMGLEGSADPFWPYGSSLSFLSLDIEESGDLAFQQDLAEGQTSLVTGAQYSSDYGNTPRFDPAQGDSAWVVQTLERDAGVSGEDGTPSGYSSLVRAANLDPFAYDGGTLAVQATLQPAPQQALHLDWRRDEFSALRIASVASPSAAASLSVHPALRSAQDGWIDYSLNPMLSFIVPINQAQTPLVKDFSFGNPYPATWEPVASLSSLYSYDITNHDGSLKLKSSESFTAFESVSDLASTPFRPRISLPRNFQVDGMPASTPRILSSTTPLVSWDPPALGTATGYTLLISRYNTSGKFLQTVARIYTSADDRSVRLPPGLLVSGTEYVLRISALYSPGVSAERSWFTLVVPSAIATTSSSLLTAP